MGKRIGFLAVLLAVLLTLCSCDFLNNYRLPGAASGDDTTWPGETDAGGVHHHVWGHWEQDENGHWQTCVDCGAVSAVGSHDPVDSEVSSPSLTTPGHSSGRACRICHRGLNGTTIYPAFVDTCGDYAYRALASRENGAAMQQFYRYLFQQCLAFHSDETQTATQEADGDWVVMSVPYSRYGLSSEEAFAVLQSVQRDCPLFYWIGNRSTTNGVELQVQTDALYAAGDARAAFNQSIYDGIVAMGIPDGTVYQRMLYLHSHVLDRMTYAYQSDGKTPSKEIWAYSVIGYFQNGSGVCETYAEICQLFANYWGIENVMVAGTVEGEGHAWNLIRMESGDWYWFDFTWDDRDNGQGHSYKYFCKIDADIADRTLDAKLYAYPNRPQAPYRADVPVGTAFTQNGFSYTVTGYGEVELNEVNASGHVAIPAEVIHEGQTYRVVTIGKAAENTLYPVFQGWITSVHIPETVRNILGNAFNSYYIERITVEESNPHLYADGTALYQKETKTMLCYLVTAESTVFTVPDGTASIASGTFVFNPHLQRVVLPKSITSISSGAFYECKNLKTIVFSGTEAQWKNVSIGTDALKGYQIEFAEK